MLIIRYMCVDTSIWTSVEKCVHMHAPTIHLIANPVLIPEGWYWDGTVTREPASPLNWRATVPVSFRDGNEDTLGLAVPKKKRSTNGGNGSTRGRISHVT